MKLKVAVLISGRGSNMCALIDEAKRQEMPVEFVGVISNRADAGGLEIAQSEGIPTHVIDHKKYESREEFDAAMDTILRDWGTQLICLAGFMRLLSADFVTRWKDRLINIHPSLLPAFKGLHVHERAIDSGVRFTGCTVHFVRPETDEGPIIAQAVVPVMQDDSAESLAARILEQEHVIYPLALRLIAEGRIRVSGEKVEIRDGACTMGSMTNPVIDI